MEESVFTKIIRGEIPSHRVYEDDRVFAFLDIHPVQPGHVLVIPKHQVAYLWDMSDEDYQAVMAVCQKIALRIREVLQVPFVGLQVIGIDVPHAHVHLIPFHTSEEFRQGSSMATEPDHTKLAEIAAKLAF